MARREYTGSFKCAVDGCNKFTHWVCDTLRERAEVFQQQATRPWRCLRHARPEEVIAPGISAHYSSLHVGRDRFGMRFCGSDGKWRQTYADGPGFRLFAEDFPAGTVIQFTVEVQLPDVNAQCAAVCDVEVTGRHSPKCKGAE